MLEREGEARDWAMCLLQHSESVQSLCLTLKTPKVEDPRLEGTETQAGSSELSLQRQVVRGHFVTEPFSCLFYWKQHSSD